MAYHPLDNLSPETRQRVENAFQALGGGGTPQHVALESRQFAHHVPGASGYLPEGGRNGMFAGTNPVFSSQSATAPKTWAWDSDVWARWEYLADEWALFDQVDWVSVRNRCVLVLLLTPLLSLVIMAVLWIRFWPEPQSLVFEQGMLLLTLGPWPIIAAALALSRAHKRHLARQDLTQPHRVTFSRAGLWEAGTYFKLHGVVRTGFQALKSVKLTARPTVLHFRMSGLAQRMHVLVPRGHEAEAEQLRQRYDAEAIHVWRKLNNPPEPR